MFDVDHLDDALPFDGPAIPGSPGAYKGPGAAFARRRGWSGGGQLFTGNVDASNGGAGRSTEARCAADFSQYAGHPDARNFIVQFNLVNVKGIPCRPQATINWMVEGKAVTRRFDVVDGMTFTGAGQAVDVVVKDVTDPTLDFTGLKPLGQPYMCMITITPGTRSAQEQPPTLWDSWQRIGPDSGANIVIPADAGVISVEVVAIASNPPMVLRAAFEAGNNVLKSWDVATFPRWIPVPPQATILNVANQDGTAEHNVEVTVTWGIDG